MLSKFCFESKQVRVEEQNGESMWIAKDVCNVLEIQNVSQALNDLDDDEKGICNIYTPGGKQEMLAVNESGLYSLIFKSRKPQAKPFKRWITHEYSFSTRSIKFIAI